MVSRKGIDALAQKFPDFPGGEARYGARDELVARDLIAFKGGVVKPYGAQRLKI